MPSPRHSSGLPELFGQTALDTFGGILRAVIRHQHLVGRLAETKTEIWPPAWVPMQLMQSLASSPAAFSPCTRRVPGLGGFCVFNIFRV